MLVEQAARTAQAISRQNDAAGLPMARQRLGNATEA
jgi:hypothetical protein